MEQTKIICTLGPSTMDLEVLCGMIKAGMDVARLNFSHGNREQHKQIIELLKRARKKTGVRVPLMVDTRGPEIRTGEVEGEVILEEDSVVTIVCSRERAKKERCTGDTIYVTYDRLPKEVLKGQKLLIDDGHIQLEVTGISGKEITAVVTEGGKLISRRSVNVPDSKLELPTLAKSDREDIKFSLEKDADFVAASFIRNAENVIEIRNFLDKNEGRKVKIISKIENKEGVEHLHEILDLSDGIMVARGDLGVELPYSKVPGVQQRMIDNALTARKVVVTATEMLDSMKHKATPTRAEVSDVYTSVLQSTTAVMLSAETATGKYPVEAVKTMAAILDEAEKEFDYRNRFYALDFAAQGHVTTSVCYAVVATAYNVRAKAIVAFTQSGYTARNVSAFRPSVPIVLVSPNEKVVRQGHMLWGVTPVLTKDTGNIEDLFGHAKEITAELGLVENGDSIVMVAGTPVGVAGSTNTLRVDHIGPVVLRGFAAREGEASGTINICRTPREAESISKGNVAIVFKLDSSYLESLKRASAILVASSNYDINVLEELKHIDIPILVDVSRTEKNVRDGMKVTVLGEKGVVLKQ